MATPSEFEKNMRKRAERLEKNVNVIVRKAAVAVDAVVVQATPVDTGRARSNWQAAIGSAPSSEIPAYSPGTGGSTASSNTKAALDQARAVIATRQSGQAIHITNNLPYIGRLNDGWSAQAPAGFVQAAVLKGLDVVRKLAKRVVSDDMRGLD